MRLERKEGRVSVIRVCWSEVFPFSANDNNPTIKRGQAERKVSRPLAEMLQGTFPVSPMAGRLGLPLAPLLLLNFLGWLHSQATAVHTEALAAPD